MKKRHKSQIGKPAFLIQLSSSSFFMMIFFLSCFSHNTKLEPLIDVEYSYYSNGKIEFSAEYVNGKLDGVSVRVPTQNVSVVDFKFNAARATSVDEINNIIQNKQAIYDLKVDKRVNKVGSGSKLVKYNFEKLPNYLKENKEYFQKWLD